MTIPVLLALGSNLGNREDYLRRAVKELRAAGALMAIAPLYRTPPMGILEQPPFYNTAIRLDVQLAAREVLQCCKDIEARVGRRPGKRWGPREIDIDVILYGQQIAAFDKLHIPHPEFRKRRFVLQPLADIAGAFRDPQTGKALETLLQECPDRSSLELIKQNWFADDPQF